jgi:DNA-directed RNA polymerase specialized sigma24 family protein
LPPLAASLASRLPASAPLAPTTRRAPPRSLPTLPWPRSAPDDPATALGIDVVRRLKDIENITLGKFRGAALRSHIDPDDLVAEVVAAICRKNRQPCAYDPRRASFSKYVYQVALSTLSNQMAAEHRFRNLCAVGFDELPDALDPHDAAEALEALDEATPTALLAALEERVAERPASAPRPARAPRRAAPAVPRFELLPYTPPPPRPRPARRRAVARPRPVVEGQLELFGWQGGAPLGGVAAPAPSLRAA